MKHNKPVLNNLATAFLLGSSERYNAFVCVIIIVTTKFCKVLPRIGTTAPPYWRCQMCSKLHPTTYYKCESLWGLMVVCYSFTLKRLDGCRWNLEYDESFFETKLGWNFFLILLVTLYIMRRDITTTNNSKHIRFYLSVEPEKFKTIILYHV